MEGSYFFNKLNLYGEGKNKFFVANARGSDVYGKILKADFSK